MKTEKKFIPLLVPDLYNEDIESAVAVLKSGMLVQGTNVENFEKEICEITGAKFAAAVSNGTATLHLILHALGIGEGDEVIVPAYSYIATANVVELVGAKPVFVDIQLETCNIDVNLIEEKITGKTKAIMPVHEFGMAANLEKIQNLCTKYNLFLIEDAACALGGEFEGKPIGFNSFAASFSFHPRKAVTSGEGGMVVSNDENLINQIKVLRNHGMSLNSDRMDFELPGFNYRLTDFQAALVLSQLTRLSEQLSAKRKLASVYFKNLNPDYFTLPTIPSYTQHAWQSFHVILNSQIDRDNFIVRLRQAGIGSNLGAQCMPAMQYFQNKYKLNCRQEFPNAWQAYQNGLVLPIYTPLQESDIQYITEVVNTTARKIIHGE